MSAFFTQIAEAETHPPRGPLNYARALRDAKLAVRNKEVDGKKPWADPFYWAPFVLVGKE